MTRLAAQLRDAAEEHPRLTAALLVALAAVVLLARLSTPDRIIFDEVYYVDDARGYLETGVEPSFAVHPTLGKWLIAAGIAVVGDAPLGWRVAAALAGVLTVLLTHLLARRLLAGTRWGPLLAVVAPLLLLTDGLFLVQSRIAMLDAFLVTAVVGGMLLLVVDRDRRYAGPGAGRRPRLRWLAGVVFGLALSVKWSALLALGAAGLLVIAWELSEAARTTTTAGGLVRSTLRRAVGVVGSLVVVPLVVYVVSWAPWLAAYEHTWAADCEDVEPVADCEDADAPVGERLDGLWRYHDAMLGFHLGLESEHSYRADPLGWVVLERPVVYYWESCSEDRANGVLVEDEETGEMVPPEPCEVPVGTSAEILAVGNPLLWWGFLAGVPVLAGGLVRRDRRSAVPLVTWLGLWAPWLLVSRAAFLFYLAPAIPFLALGLVVAVDRLDRRHRILGAYAGAVLGAALGLGTAWATQLLGAADEGWRPRLLTMAVGIAIGTLAGAALDHRRERDATGPVTPPLPEGRPDQHRAAHEPGVRPDGHGVHDPGALDGGDPVATRSAGAVALAAPGPAVDDDARPRDDAPVRAEEDRAASDLAPHGAPVAAAGADPGIVARADGAAVPLAPEWRVPAITLALVVTAVSLWVFFGPVWYGVPLARDVLRWRWWFATWI